MDDDDDNHRDTVKPPSDTLAYDVRIVMCQNVLTLVRA